MRASFLLRVAKRKSPLFFSFVSKMQLVPMCELSLIESPLIIVATICDDIRIVVAPNLQIVKFRAIFVIDNNSIKRSAKSFSSFCFVEVGCSVQNI